MAEAKIILSAEDRTRAAFSTAAKSVKDLHGHMAGMGDSAAGLMARFGPLGVAIGAAFTGASVKGAIDLADRIDDLSEKTGIATEMLSGLGYAGEIAGTPLEAMAAGIKKLSVNMADAAGGGKESAAAFKALGIQVQSTTGALKGSDAMLLELADKFAGFRDGPEKAALAIALFGKAGEQMIPFLNKGAAGIAELRAEAEKLGIILGGDAAKRAADFNDNLKRLESTAVGAKMAIANELLPTLNALTNEFLTGIQVFGNWRSALLNIGLKTSPFDGWAEGAKKARDEIADLEKRMANIATSGGKNDTLKARSKSALEAQIDTARKQLEYFEKLQKQVIDRGAAAAEAGYWGNAQKPSAPIVDKKTDAKEKANEYDGLNKRIQERLGLQKAELAQGRELTEQEKFEAKALEDMALAKKGLTAQQKAGILAGLEESKQLAAGIALRKSEYEQAMDMAKERQRLKAEGYAEAEKLKAANEATASAQLKTGKELLEQLQFDTAALTMNAQEREKATITRELERQGIVKGTEAWDRYYDALIKATGQKAATQTAIDDFRSVWESVDRTAHDAFTNIFQGGKDVFTKLRDTLKSTLLDLLYQMTVKKWIFNIAASVTGTAGGIAQAATGGTGGSVLSAIGSGSSVLGAIGATGSLGAGLATGLGAWSGGLAGVGGALSAGTSLMAGGSIAGGLGMLAGALGPVALALAGLYAVFGSKGGGPKVEGGTGWGVGNFGDVGAAKKLTDSLTQGYAEAARAFGVKVADVQFGSMFSKDPKGTSNTQFQVAASLGGTEIYNRFRRTGGLENVGRSDEEFQAAAMEDSTRAIFAAIKATAGLSDVMKQVLGTTDAYTSSLDDISAAMERAKTVGAQRAQLEETLFDLTSTDLEKLTRARERERAAIDPLNASLLESVYVQQDLAREVERANAIAAERTGLERQLMQLTGDIAGLRALELAALDESNRGLQERIWGLQDEAAARIEAERTIQAAADSARQAQERYASAMRDAQDYLRGFAVNVNDYLNRLSGTDAGMGSPESQLTNSAAQFQQQLAKARTGDRDAMGSITSYADQYIAAGKGYYASGSQAVDIVNQVKAALIGLPAQIRPEQLIVDAIYGAGGFVTGAVGEGAAMTTRALEALQANVVARLATDFARLDTTLDGNLSAAEFMAGLGTLASADVMRALFDKLDVNGDGQISKLEAIAGATTRTAADTSNGVVPILGRLSGDMHNDLMDVKGMLHYDLGVISGQLAGVLNVRSETRAAAYPTMFADGGAFTNGIVSRPTLFPLGLMGEKTEEAIMPLARTPGGALGVRSMGGGGDGRALESRIDRLIATNERQHAQIQHLTAVLADYAQKDLALGRQAAAAALRAHEAAQLQEARAVTA